MLHKSRQDMEMMFIQKITPLLVGSLFQMKQVRKMQPTVTFMLKITLIKIQKIGQHRKMESLL